MTIVSNSPPHQPIPSTGRIVIVRDRTRPASNGLQEHPAIVNRAWSDTMVNVTVFPDCGESYYVGSVELIDPASDEARGWFWPPRV